MRKLSILLVIVLSLSVANVASSRFLVVTSSSVSSGNGGGATSWIGVPDPDWGATIGNPIVATQPTRPDPWDSHDPGYYYVYEDQVTPSCSDSNNGYPGAARCTIPTPIPAGAYVEVVGPYTTTSGGSTRINSAGTITQPTWLVNDDLAAVADFQAATTTIEGNYIFIDGVEFSTRVLPRATDTADYVAIRNSTFDVLIDGTGSQLGTGGQIGDPAEQWVVYANTFKDSCVGWNQDPGIDKDAHGSKPGNYAQYIWYVGNTFYHSCGNAIQLSDQNSSQANVHHIYIAGNEIYQTRQTGIGVKKASDVVISENYIHDISIIQTGNTPSGIAWQYAPGDLWVIYNTIDNTEIGIKSGSDTSPFDDNVYVIGNLITNISTAQSYTSTNPWHPGLGMSLVDPNNVWVINNTIRTAEGGIGVDAQISDNLYIENNIIADMQESQYHLLLESGISPANFVFANNQCDTASATATYIGGTTNSCSGVDASNNEGDPLFVSASDHSLQISSPAVDDGVADTALQSDVYQTFETAYGLDIRVDINGTSRPQGSAWDMGAYERSSQVAWVPPVGIPNPGFGIEDVAPSTSTACPGWPDLDSSCYYVNNSVTCTNTGNDNGYPNNPRCDFVEGSFAAGTYIELHGGGVPYTTGGDGRWTYSGTGTQSDPIWINCIGTPELHDPIRFDGASWHYLQGCKWTQNEATVQIPSYASASSDHIVVRNNTFEGPGTDSGASSVISASGVSPADRASYIVIYNNSITNFGEWDSLVENDYHGISPGTNADYVWVLENTMSYMGGDGSQIGTASTADENRASHIYLGRNTHHHNGENCVDIKEADNIIVSEDTCYTIRARAVGSPTGSAHVVHNEATYVWFINSLVYDTQSGITGTAQGNFYVIGNVIRDIYQAPGFDPEEDYGGVGGSAFNVRGGSGGGGVLFNTIHNAPKGLQITGPGTGFEVQNNIFSDRPNAASYDIKYQDSGDGASTTEDYNLVYDDFRGGCSSAAVATSFPWTCSTTKESNGHILDPVFTNKAANDFTLQSSSNARNEGTSSLPSAFTTFQTQYGDLYNIDKDRAGNDRCLGSACDMGAYEYVE